jgi:hypothetical protein
MKSTLKNTKFWVTLATLVIQVAIFIFLRLSGPVSDAVTISEIAGVVTTLAAFGTLNVIASGQAPVDPGKQP